MIRRAPRSALFPYTTLSRSSGAGPWPNSWRSSPGSTGAGPSTPSPSISVSTCWSTSSAAGRSASPDEHSWPLSRPKGGVSDAAIPVAHLPVRARDGGDHHVRAGLYLPDHRQAGATDAAVGTLHGRPGPGDPVTNHYSRSDRPGHHGRRPDPDHGYRPDELPVALAGGRDRSLP